MKNKIHFLLLMEATRLTKAQDNSEAKAKQLVSKMTLEQKTKLALGLGMKLPGMPQNSSAKKDKVPGAAGNTFAIPETCSSYNGTFRRPRQRQDYTVKVGASSTDIKQSADSKIKDRLES